jgi:hypothetical protein
MVMQQVGARQNAYYFAYGAGKLGWSDGGGRGPSASINLPANKWSHLVHMVNKRTPAHPLAPSWVHSRT